VIEHAEVLPAASAVRFVQPDLRRGLLAILPAGAGAELRVRLRHNELGWSWKCSGCSGGWRRVTRSTPCSHVSVVLDALHARVMDGLPRIPPRGTNR